MNENITVKEEEMTLITSRIMKAPRDLVYRCFVEQEMVDKWYGPKGCHIETSHMDVQEGGVWKYTMYMPNGKSFDAYQVYTKIIENEQVIFDSAQSPDAPKDQWFLTQVDFKEHDDGTEVIISMSYTTEEMFAQAKKFGAIKGYVAALEKMEEFVLSINQ